MIRYSRKRRRWETHCALCGRLVWSRISRIRIFGNLSARHGRRRCLPDQHFRRQRLS